MKNDRKLDIEKIASNMTWWIGSTSSLIFHTLFFIISFLLPVLTPVPFDRMFLILTTVVSLEAIYLSIFIQMSVNKNTEHIGVIKEDIEEIQEDIEEITDDIDEIQEDIDEIQEDIDEIQEDIEEIAEEEDFINNPELSKEEIIELLKENVKKLKTQIKELKA